jgi:hypothetical protein
LQEGQGSRHQGTATMQAMPDSRQQSFEEIYGPPENFLEIEVSSQSPSPAPNRGLPPLSLSPKNNTD